MMQEIDLRPLEVPYFRHLQLLSEALEQEPEQILMLAFSDYSRFECAMCAACCKSWTVRVTQDYVSQWQSHWDQQPDKRYQKPFAELEPNNPEAFAVLRKQPDGVSCVFLQENNACYIHHTLGAEAKPEACQNYPRMIQPQSNGYLTTYTLKSCQSVPALSLQDQAIYYHIFAQAPQAFPPAVKTDVVELPRTQQYLWLGLVLDALDLDQGNILLRLGHLAQVLEMLIQQRSSWEQLYKFALSPARAKTVSLQGMGLIIRLFESELASLAPWFQNVQVEMTPADRDLLNQHLKTYLRQKWVTQVYSEPFHMHLSMFHHATIVAILSVSVTVYAFYLADQSRGRLRLEHIARAIHVVERRLSHSLEWYQKLGLADLKDKQALLCFQDIASVGCDFVAP